MRIVRLARERFLFVRVETTLHKLCQNLVKRNLSKVVTLKKRSVHVLRHTFATTES